MRKLIFVFILFMSAGIVSAQNAAEKKFLLSTHSNSFGLSMLSTTDPYLSPAVYSGLGFRFNTERSRFLSTENTNYSGYGKLSLSAGMMLNPAFSSSMTYLGANYGYGIHYHLRSKKDLHALVGGIWDVDFGFKNVARNVNNPVNIDLATNLNLSAVILYDIHTRKRMLKLKLNVQTPILGCMFVPPGGASYYDMFELGNLANAFHISSLHNKRGLSQMYSVDVPFNNSTWRFGLKFDDLKYSANNLVFVRKEFSLLVGITFDVATFAGRKHTPPQNFISTNE